MTWAALGSTSLLQGIDRCCIEIICDGFRSPANLESAHATRVDAKLLRDPCALSKKGIVSERIGAAYDQYKCRLANEIACRGLHNRVGVTELPTHHGFALCVREGLLKMQRRGLRYALVCQHDRAQIRRVSRNDVALVLDRFQRDPTVNYIGLPSSTSKLQATRLAPRYKLGKLLAARSLTLRPGLVLRPSIFWFDSNHLVDVERCLACLYSPFTSAPPSVRRHCERFRPNGIGGFTLRKGDFIEDRFGTEQRALLAAMRDGPEEDLLEAFDWFGSYILEDVPAEGESGGGGSGDEEEAEEDGPQTVCELIDDWGRASHVAHMDARAGRGPRAWMDLVPRL